MSTEENKTLPRRSYEEIYNKGNLNVVDEIYDENFLVTILPVILRAQKA